MSLFLSNFLWSSGQVAFDFSRLRSILKFFLLCRYALPNLRFVKLDVGRYPKEGDRFRISTHVLSKQLPSMSVIRGGKQINRRPTIGVNRRAIPFKFTEVSCQVVAEKCLYFFLRLQENCIREFQLNNLHAECKALLKKNKQRAE